MIVSTKGRYALRVLIDLAEQPGDGYVPLGDISRRLDISREYLSSILKVLVKAGQLQALRGIGGGYRLSKDAAAYRVGEILRIVEGDLSPVSCTQSEHACPNSDHCRTYGMWAELNDVIGDYLDGVTLADFLAGGRFGPKE